MRAREKCRIDSSGDVQAETDHKAAHRVVWRRLVPFLAIPLLIVEADAVAGPSREPAGFTPPAFLSKITRQSKVAPVPPGSAPIPTPGSPTSLLSSPWRAETEFGNSDRVSTGSVDTAVLEKERTSSSRPESTSALKGGTVAMLSGLPSVAGRIPSGYGVSSMGEARYTIPIWTPPGARGIQPQLALQYSSGSGDSILGRGWSLSGLSYITRCGRTWAQDGTPAAVDLTSNDKFCLDGNRLRLTSAPPYGAPGTTYQTETEVFSKVTANGTAGTGPLWFEVKGKDGLIYEYGNTTDSRAISAVGGTTPYQWALNKVSDRQGNNMVITYSQSAGVLRPNTLQYTQTPATSLTYNYKVTFQYQARSASATATTYVASDKTQQTQVLTGILVEANGGSGLATVRQYNIDYSTGSATQLPRVSAVQTCTTTNCLKATTIAYQDGTAGIAAPSTSASTGATTGRMNTVDVDGDGRQDLVYTVTSGSNLQWYVKFASASGFGTAMAFGSPIATADATLFDDFLSEGRTTALMPQSGTWYLLRWTGSSFSSTSTGLAVASDPLPAIARFASADVDGDGRPDLVSYRSNVIYTRLNTSSGTTPAFASTETSAYSAAFVGIVGNNASPTGAVRRLDFNGDGRDDILALTATTIGGLPAFSYQILRSVGTTFQYGGLAGSAFNFLPLRFNDDDCTDIATASAVVISACNGSPAATVPYSSGPALLAADWDGDGHSDIWVNSGGTFQVYRSYGDTLSPTAISTGISVGSGNYQVFDPDGDGLDDIAYANSGAGYAISYGIHNGAGIRPDLATSFVDGFDMSVAFHYNPMTNGCYIRDVGPPTFPARVFIGPLYTACSYDASNGVSGTYTVTYGYYNANTHVQGRGFAGFERRYEIDNRTSVVTMEVYGQLFPQVGMKTYALARQSDWVTKIRETTYTLTNMSFGSGSDTRAYPYVSQIVDDAYEAGGLLNGQWITRQTTTLTPDSYGTPTSVTVATTDKSTASPYYGETYTVQTTNTITNDSGTNWCLGRPSQVEIKSTLPDSTFQTRTLSATVDYAQCRNSEEIIEPSSSTLKVTTTYGFDSCGNVNSVAVIGKNANGTTMATRTTTRNFGSRCQFPETIVNPESESTTIAYNYQLGLVGTVTDPNGAAVSLTYDGYGRQTQESRPDGTSTAWSYAVCDSSNSYCGVPNLRWQVTETQRDISSATIRYRYRLFDGFDRERYDEQLNLSGGLTYRVSAYDALGRTLAKYEPFSSGAQHCHWFSYDLLNRQTADSLYPSCTGAPDRQTFTGYEGRKRTFTDAKSNVTTRYFDVRNDLRRVDDPSPGGSLYYVYDHFRNLSATTDAIGVVSTYGFNLRGFQTSYSDPNTGSRTYEVNSFGETTSVTDALSQTITLVYDKLGRLTSRNAGGTSTFTYGTSSAAHNIGKLVSMSGPDGYSEAYTYDSIGRLSRVDYVADTSYQVDYAYNATTGLLDTTTYPLSTSGYRLQAQNVYQYGILSQVRDGAAPSTVWWQLNATDARGNPVDEQLYNGVHILANNDDMTGHLNWRTSGTNAQYNNQFNLTYQWDKNENLEKRIDVNQSNLTEQFFYDALDRLDYSKLNGTTNFDVNLDAVGNILGKSDVGSYTYDATRKHLVTSTSNGWSFGYDNNGSMTSARGSTITWHVTGLPKKFITGALSSEFYYTPDNRYWKQLASYSGGYENTIHIGSILEKVVTSAGSNYRHMIRAGSATIIVSRHSSLGNNTYYITGDHLGSSSVVTNGSGSIVVSESFKAYGERRGANWTGSPSAGDWTNIANTTRRGYTGHTMVDNFSLIHMNGRMFDPMLGRFMSADPFIPAPDSTQSFNRYSYVRNRPLSLIDPSGYSECGPVPCGDAPRGSPTPSTGPRISIVAAFDSTEDYEYRSPVSASSLLAKTQSGGFLKQLLFGILDNILEDFWESPQFDAVGQIYPATAEEYGSYSSPFPAAATNKGQLGRDLGPAAAIAVAVIVRSPTTAARGAQVTLNRAAGNVFRDELASSLSQAGREVSTEVYKRTPFGRRFIDIEVSRGGEVLGGIETKVGASRYTPLQKLKDWWLTNIEGYPVNVARKP